MGSAAAGQGEAVGMVLRSHENHMDPCFRFPRDDLQDLFDNATVTEAMLVALEHMQVHYVRVSASGFRKFRRNTLSFPQDIFAFARRHDLLKNFRPGDRVDSCRGALGDVRDPDRPERKATSATTDERGRLVIPGVVLERRADGMLVVEYEYGGPGQEGRRSCGTGLEHAQNVSPRVRMPWHPRDVPLHLLLRQNVGRGRGVLEGLWVRWHYVANLLQALCAFAPQGGEPWRLGGSDFEPMHKYYDPRMFHAMSEEEMRLEFAPLEVDGVGLEEGAAAALTKQERLARTVNAETPEQFIAAGFSVTPVGPAEEAPVGPAAAADEEGAAEAKGEGRAGVEQEEQDVLVDAETFERWLDSTEFEVGVRVQKWWARVEPTPEGELAPLKTDDDETVADLFGRLVAEGPRGDAAQAAGEDGTVGATVHVCDLVAWLREHMGWEALHGGVAVADVAILDDVRGELSIAESWKAGASGRHTGALREDGAAVDEEADAVRTAQRCVYGWARQEPEPTGAYSRGRFVMAFPLEFPMGVANLYEDPGRPWKVSVEDWVQHLLRYRTGQFVRGVRGQRVLWAMVNTLLLTEARGKGFGIYRNTVR